MVIKTPGLDTAMTRAGWSYPLLAYSYERNYLYHISDYTDTIRMDHTMEQETCLTCLLYVCHVSYIIDYTDIIRMDKCLQRSLGCPSGKYIRQKLVVRIQSTLYDNAKKLTCSLLILLLRSSATPWTAQPLQQCGIDHTRHNSIIRIDYHIFDYANKQAVRRLSE